MVCFYWPGLQGQQADLLVRGLHNNFPVMEELWISQEDKNIIKEPNCRGGPAGIMNGKYVELNSDFIYPYNPTLSLTLKSTNI